MVSVPGLKKGVFKVVLSRRITAFGGEISFNKIFVRINLSRIFLYTFVFHTQIFFMGNLGFQEILLIAVVILVLFGSRKIPEFMRGLGKGIREFNDAKDNVKKELEDGMKQQNTTTAPPPAAAAPASTTQQSS